MEFQYITVFAMFYLYYSKIGYQYSVDGVDVVAYMDFLVSQVFLVPLVSFDRSDGDSLRKVFDHVSSTIETFKIPIRTSHIASMTITPVDLFYKFLNFSRFE